MRRLAIGLLALLAACVQTPADEAISVCGPLCHCADVPLPAEQRTCTATCITQFERNPLDEVCIDCVIAHANRCTTLTEDCSPVCIQTVPLGAYGRTAMSSESRFDR